MKKLSIYFLICFSVILSCTKSDSDIQKVDENAISSVMQLKTVAQIKNAYALLNSSEKVELWNRHFNYFTQSQNLSKDQTNFIISLKKQWLKNDLFDKSSTRLVDFNLALPGIKYKAQQLFGVSDTYTLLFDLTAFKNKYAKQTLGLKQNQNETIEVYSDEEEPIGEIGGSNGCKCSRTDPYCSAGRCDDNGCNTSNMGCGTLWLFSCNGVCKFL
ncbi:MAG: bacteriocin fulvocin C-related protein [Flavobacterium sp.]|nr:bacteriocin fulvocin C-related protein [Flavobacterium sp.]